MILFVDDSSGFLFLGSAVETIYREIVRLKSRINKVLHIRSKILEKVHTPIFSDKYRVVRNGSTRITKDGNTRVLK